MLAGVCSGTASCQHVALDQQAQAEPFAQVGRGARVRTYMPLFGTMLHQALGLQLEQRLAAPARG
jgi:hypothetical protein